MNNPYRDLPDHAFWRRAVSAQAPLDVDPVVEIPFRISPSDKVATAGSCFAQHIARTLVDMGFHYLVTEKTTSPDGENYGVFPARFGNLYTVRQLLQLFERAYGLFDPIDKAWRRPDGAFVDPFRPLIQSAGFATMEALEQDRAAHLASVRAMFEECDVFIFTLGLTEGWESTRDGAVFPLAPGVSGSPEDAGEGDYRFVNFGVNEMAADLLSFVSHLRAVRPQVRIVLTVSPVSLIATYEKRHVLVSTIYSKSVLRVVAQMACDALPDVAYFPSFEIITGHHHRYAFFEPDLRSVSAEGVAHVMSIFRRHYLGEGGAPVVSRQPAAPQLAVKPTADSPAPPMLVKANLAQLNQIVCDEEILDR
jgi:hypothetical protein